MYEKELFDETLDINSTNNYEISIQVSLNGFSFSLLDTLRNRFVMLREYKLSGKENEICGEIEGIIDKDEFLRKSYHRYHIIFSFERNTLVPSGLFDPALKDDYFKLNHLIKEGYVVSNNRLTNPDSVLLFDIRKDILDLFVNAFPEASLSHQVRPLLNSVFSKTKKTTDKYIRVNIEDTYFNIFVITGQNLQFFNTFRYRNTSDILYFTLFTFENLDLGKDETLYLSGQIEKDDELYNGFMKYVTSLKFTKPEGSFSMSYIFDNIDIHRYSNLFNIVNCV
ncbi:MAG: DUF3822 family protein [Bacteroidales bacterium]|nr:DUF3822 family protein [Bacteroidales bacterium]